MEEEQAVSALAALGQVDRLRIVRHLVRAGPDGAAAGRIAEALGLAPSRLTFHLRALEGAGLVPARQVSRSRIYAARFEALGALIGFLTDDCCANDPRVRAGF